ncbi:MAG: class I SAM-dependent methyltransferase [Deltaproteobacteria bacterium]|nr:class I SAM-dependent methyltransferase [Deltaproteobacteria bacterium]
MPDDQDDVPIRVDHRDPATARAWLEDTRLRRPFRASFRAAFCAALAPNRQLRILELGSGPGELAREILLRCDVRSYVALDWSQAMHDIANEHLGDLANRVTFIVRDFREPTWPAGLGIFDAIVTQQAVHETRHRRHALPLFERARTLLAPGGVLLYCDGYLVDPEAKLAALVLERGDQPRVLERAGFVDVRLLHDEGNLALYRATNPR